MSAQRHLNSECVLAVRGWFRLAGAFPRVFSCHFTKFQIRIEDGGPAYVAINFIVDMKELSRDF